MNDLESLDIEKVAKAIEADAGEPQQEIRQALAEAKTGEGRVTAPEQILVRSARRVTGLTQAVAAALKAFFNGDANTAHRSTGLSHNIQ